MNKKEFIDEFLNGEKIAVVGASADKRKFGYTVFNELINKSFDVVPVNPKLVELEGRKCYPGLLPLKGNLERAIIVIPPLQTEKVVEDALNTGIKYIWMQLGADSKKAIDFCIKNGINLIYNECILLYAQPVVSIHKFHRIILKIFGKIPA